MFFPQDWTVLPSLLDRGFSGIIDNRIILPNALHI